MSERESLCRRFLDQAGWGNAKRTMLAADASFRTYDRLILGEKTAVLMNAPPPQENVKAFYRVEEILLKLGFSAPRCLARDLDHGFLLLEDLGDRTFTRALAGGAEESRLYELALDLLVALHERAPEDAEGLPFYDAKKLEEEVLLLPDWYYEAVTGHTPSPEMRRRYIDAWRPLWEAAASVPSSLVLRDYHVDNLMILEGRSGVRSCGLLDFQDALCGPVTYDLVSLLQDARRDISADLEEAMTSRYLAANEEVDREAFERSYLILGAQRAAKIIGIFTRLSRRDHKDHYLAHVPRVWKILESNLVHDGLGGVTEWFDEFIPQNLRIRPENRSDEN